MKTLIILTLILLLTACNGIVIDTPTTSLDTLKIDLTALKLKIDTLNVLQDEYAKKTDLNEYEINQLKTTVNSIDKLITLIDARINAIVLPDTVKQYIGNGNLIYKGAIGLDTVNFMIDTVTFKIWKTGAEIN